MNKLDNQDLAWSVRRLPKHLKKIMEEASWKGKIFVGGGYLRSLVSGEPINDVDLFVGSEKEAELLALKLDDGKKEYFKTENAYTVKGIVPIQIIYRWVFNKPEDVANSFDFTICCAVIYLNEKGEWDSYIDQRFYIDLASKRLIYRNPVRNEDAGGSMLRVLKYYQKGYRIPLDSLGAVVARMIKVIDITKIEKGLSDEEQVAKVITGLLREVDPNIDPLHQAHLPSSLFSNVPILPEEVSKFDAIF